MREKPEPVQVIKQRRDAALRGLLSGVPYIAYLGIQFAPGAGELAVLLGATWALMLITLGMAVLAAPVKQYTDEAASQLADTSAYVRAVLGPDAAGRSTTQPYDGRRNPPAPAGIPEAPR